MENLKQGLYTMANEDYHRGRGAFAISKSGLKKMVHPDSPRIFKYESDLPGEQDVFDKKHMETFNPGTALHTKILEPDLWDKEIYVIPDGERVTQPLKNTVMAMGKTPIRHYVAEMVQDVHKLLHSGEHETARKILTHEKNRIELSGFWQDKSTGVWCKTRPDLIAWNGIVWDVKTNRNVGKPWSDTCFNLCYHWQAAMALDGLTAITGRQHSIFGHIVFDIDKPPYDIGVRYMDEELIDIGQTEYMEALYLYAECLKNDKWPGRYPDEIEVVYPPKWAMNKPY